MVTKIALVTGTEHTIINPAINKIIDDINHKVFKDKNVIVYKGYVTSNDNVTVDKNVRDNDTLKGIIDVDVSVTTNESLTVSLNSYKPINKVILYDSDNSLAIRPLYVSTDLNLRFKYSNKSKSKVLAIKDKLQMFYNTTDSNILHDIPYSYIIPTNILSLIDNIRVLKGYTSNLISYVESITRFRFEVASTKDNRYKVPVFRGSQLSTIGNFTTTPSEIEVQKDDLEYYIEFNYIVTIDNVGGLAIQYPLIVNNIPIDKKWIPAKEVDRIVDLSSETVNINQSMLDLINNPDIGISGMYKFPSYDNWIPMPGSNDNHQVRVLSILLQVDNNNPNIVFNIDDLTLLGLDSKLVNHMKTLIGAKLFQYSSSVLLFELYEKDNIRDLKLYMDAEYNILTELPMDISSSYHLVLNIVTDTNFLNYLDNDRKVKELEICNYLNLPITTEATYHVVSPKRTADIVSGN